MFLESRLIFAFISCLFFLHSSAQITVVEEKRIEHDGVVASCVTPQNKIITYSLLSEKGSDDQIEIVAYNEHFKEQGRFETKCAEKYLYKTNALSGSGEYYFSLVVDKDKKIHSVVFDTQLFEGTELHVDLEEKFVPNGNLDVLGGLSTVCFKNKFFILGTVKKVPCILVYNMLTGTQHLTFIPGMDKKMRVSFLSTNEAAPSLQLMYYNYKSKKVNVQFLASINEFGELEGKPIPIAVNKGQLLIDGNVTWIDESSYLLCGATGSNSSVAKGMYIIEIQDGQLQRRNDYDFNDFRDFYSTLNAKMQKKIERKKSRKKNFESQCYMVTHPVVFNENAWTITGEVFYPTYRTELRTVYVNGRPTTQTVYVFDGFAYSHAVVLQVSPELEKIKDYSFNLDIDDKPFYVKKFVRIKQVDTKLNFYYASRNRFGHASLENGGITESETLTIINKEEDLKDSEKLTSISGASVSYWYENYYLIAETIGVKDKDASAGRKRKEYLQFKKIKIEEP
jgi:hypothetical protein